MKTNPYTLLFLFVIITMNAKGQATANVAVDIIAPTGISKIFDGFDNPLRISADPSVTVKQKKPGKGSATNNSGSNTVEIHAANLILSDNPNYTYSISLPGNPLIAKNGASSISIDEFSFDQSTIAGKERASQPVQSIDIKVQVNLPRSTVAGIYTGTKAINIVVNYN